MLTKLSTAEVVRLVGEEATASMDHGNCVTWTDVVRGPEGYRVYRGDTNNVDYRCHCGAWGCDCDTPQQIGAEELAVLLDRESGFRRMPDGDVELRFSWAYGMWVRRTYHLEGAKHCLPMWVKPGSPRRRPSCEITEEWTKLETVDDCRETRENLS